MTVTKTYRCELCRDVISPTPGVPRQGFGVHYHAYSPPACGRGLAFRPSADCERHICVACAKGVHDEVRRVTPATQAQG